MKSGPKPGRAKGHYAIRANNLKSGKVTSWCLTVPMAMAAVVPPGALFVPELTEDGILYRLVSNIPTPALPGWAAQPEQPKNGQ